MLRRGGCCRVRFRVRAAVILFSLAVSSSALAESLNVLAEPLSVLAESGGRQSVDHQERVYVRTLHSQKSIRLTGFGIRFLNQDVAMSEESALPRRRQYLISREKNGWAVADLRDVSSEPRFFSGDELRVSGEMLRYENLAAPNDLILKVRQERFDVIADVLLEDYLKGVLPSEMPPQWPLEAFKAQAVAARTYILNVIRAKGSDIKLAKDGYYVDDSIRHQVFQPQNYVGASLSVQDKVTRAIRETQGQYLTDGRGEPYRTYFHSDCGGETEEPEFIWGPARRAGTVKDERCQVNPLSAWSTEILRSELESKLQKKFALSDTGALTNVVVASRTSSGRIHQLNFQFERVQEEGYTLNSQEFRRLFGFNRVKSTNFSMRLSPQKLELKGRGHGHGAGMCQKGARFMALAGAKFSDILKRYYPRAILISPSMVPGPSIAPGSIAPGFTVSKQDTFSP